MLTKHTEAPLGGLVGVPLINVLEVNLALRDRMKAARREGLVEAVHNSKFARTALARRLLPI